MINKQLKNQIMELNGQGKTVKEISRLLNIGAGRLTSFYFRNKIRSQSKFYWTPERLEFLKKNTHQTLYKIAEALGTTRECVSRKLIRLGLGTDASRKTKENKNLKLKNLRKCHICQKILPIEEFNGQYKTYCPLCSSIKTKNIYKERIKNLTLNDLIRIKYTSVKIKAEKRKIPFLITQKDLIEMFHKQNGSCSYSGIKMEIALGKYSLSIDRINAKSKEGYTKTNVTLCCSWVNVMKHDKTKEELIAMCNKIADFNR